MRDDDRLPIRRDPLADMHHWLDPDTLDHRRALDVPHWRKAARRVRRWLAFEGLRLGVLVLWLLVTGGTLTALGLHYGLLSPPAALDRPLAAFLAGIWLGLAALAFGYFGRRWLRRAQLRRPDDLS